MSNVHQSPEGERPVKPRALNFVESEEAHNHPSISPDLVEETNENLIPLSINFVIDNHTGEIIELNFQKPEGFNCGLHEIVGWVELAKYYIIHNSKSENNNATIV